MVASKPATILYGESDAKELSTQTRMLEKAGYKVVPALGRQALEDAVAHTAFHLLILGHTLTKDERHHLAYMAKKFNASSRVLVLHASGKHPKVDLAVDSRGGERVVLDAVAQLLALGAAHVSQAAGAAVA